MITLYNLFHAGDVAMTRPIIREIVAANPGAELRLSCFVPHAYLWTDLSLPICHAVPGEEPQGPAVNLHFAAFQEHAKTGLTYETQRSIYHKQCAAMGLHPLAPFDGKPRFLDFPERPRRKVTRPAVLLETGPVLSGQRVYDLVKAIPTLRAVFPEVVWYTASATGIADPYVRSVAWLDLPALAGLSEECDGIVGRLSGVMVATFTERNHGRKRVVYAEPLGCPIWDEVGLVYAHNPEQLVERLREALNEAR